MICTVVSKYILAALLGFKETPAKPGDRRELQDRQQNSGTRPQRRGVPLQVIHHWGPMLFLLTYGVVSVYGMFIVMPALHENQFTLRLMQAVACLLALELIGHWYLARTNDSFYKPRDRFLHFNGYPCRSNAMGQQLLSSSVRDLTESPIRDHLQHTDHDSELSGWGQLQSSSVTQRDRNESPTRDHLKLKSPNSILMKFKSRTDELHLYSTPAASSNSPYRTSLSILDESTSCRNADIFHNGSRLAEGLENGRRIPNACKETAKSHDGTWTACNNCKWFRPPLCHHCPLCRRCVLQRDHHCYVTGVCIGMKNHLHFMVFLFWLTCGCLFCSAYMYPYTYYEILPRVSYLDFAPPVVVIKGIFGYIDVVFIVLCTLFWVINLATVGSVLYLHRVACHGLKDTTRAVAANKMIRVKNLPLLMEVLSSILGLKWLLNFIIPFHRQATYSDEALFLSLS